MELRVTRLWLTDQSTCGELSLDGGRLCYTLELPNKDGQPGSCIPQGRYPVSVYPSPKFGRLMPLVGVPRRTTIEIHWGNYPHNTEGCILLGHTHEPDFVGESKNAFDEFWAKTQGPMERGECWLSVIGGYKEPESSGDIHMEVT